MTIKEELMLYYSYLKEVIKDIIDDIRGPKPPFGHV